MCYVCCKFEYIWQKYKTDYGDISNIETPLNVCVMYSVEKIARFLASKTSFQLILFQPLFP